MPNRLGNAASLYLRRHANDPVDWFAWGPDALAAAARLDRPLFISIGYSSCHWCHVMGHESFADAEVAQVLNRHYVAIKIDREEHPDIDAQYMTALQLLSGHGGWPMTVFALPDGRPFFAGTYFPKQPKYGQPGFMHLLARIAELWRSERDKLEVDADALAAAVRRRTAPPPPAAVVPAAIADVLTATLDSVDEQYGGHLGAPKFPPHEDLRLWQWALAQGADNPALKSAWRRTLDGMAFGGLRDQLGGAFHRYTVDAGWRVPHFEQMLYDNAQLLLTYSDAAAWGGDPVDAAVAAALVDELQNRWLTDDGWLAAAWDADDSGGEGAYYTWTRTELAAVLAANDAAWACSYFQVPEHGPVEGRSTLAPDAAPRGDSQVDNARLARVRTALLAARAQRPAPERDNKGVAAWNGLALVGLAQAARVLDSDVVVRFAEVAAVARRRAAAAAPQRAWYRDGGVGTAQLEDEAALALGLWRFGLAADDPKTVAAALALGARMLDRFYDNGDWNAAGDVSLLGTPAGWWDGQTPSAFALALEFLTEWSVLVGDERAATAGDRLQQQVSGAMAAAPQATRGLWRVCAQRDRGVVSVVLQGAATAAWAAAARRRLTSDVVVIGPDVAAWAAQQQWAALAGRAQPQPRAYVCRGRACALPADNETALTEQLLAIYAT